MIKHLFLLLVLQFHSIRTNEGGIPIVITTWRFENAARKAWDEIQQSSALKAIVNGAGVCEIEQCDRTVGYGGSPDEAGETTLDALIMDGKNMKVGAVGSLRRIKNAIGVAKCVMDHTEHSFLVGELATEFAVQMGFKEEVLTTTESKQMWMAWHNKNKCQPNFWTNVIPNPKETCGPYEPVTPLTPQIYVGPVINEHNHDTIGMVAIDSNGDVAAGTSTNGAKFKIPGRIGDSPIPGAGAYADNEVGGAAATGDGDVMLRFLPSFLAVEEMRRGASPADATKTAISRIIRYYPRFMGAVIAVNKTGSYAASCHGLPTFPYIVHHKDKFSSEPLIVECM